MMNPVPFSDKEIEFYSNLALQNTSLKDLSLDEIQSEYFLQNNRKVIKYWEEHPEDKDPDYIGGY